MKVRTDYVSNSSSSSFVLANMEFFNHFDIAKDDILNALVDAYGVEAYKKSKVHILKSVKEHPDWYEDDLKWNRFGPFYVYDLSIPDERKEAVSRWGELLKNWTANNCRYVSGKGCGAKQITIDPLLIQEYKTAISGIANVYDISEYELEDVASGKSPRGCKRFVRTNKKDPKTGMYGHYEPISKELVKVVREMRKNSGVMTNLDAIKSKVARFFVHADDNVLCNGLMCELGKDENVYNKDMDAYVYANGSWNTESCTYDRVCEILLNYLVKIGKVKLDDPAFLEKMKVGQKYLTENEKKEGRIYDFCNGLQFSWRDLEGQSLTWCMHEG